MLLTLAAFRLLRTSKAAANGGIQLSSSRYRMERGDFDFAHRNFPQNYRLAIAGDD
jgi:hypothetical protein